MNTFFKLGFNVDQDYTQELAEIINDAISSSNADLQEGWSLDRIERSGPRMEIFNHDDEPRCIRVFDDYDPICDVLEDGNVVFLASSTDAKDMQLVVNIAANFKFFYNSL